jgi:hypothetical protein
MCVKALRILSSLMARTFAWSYESPAGFWWVPSVLCDSVGSLMAMLDRLPDSVSVIFTVAVIWAFDRWTGSPSTKS